MDKVKVVKADYAHPGDAMDQQEFEKMIKEAEKGPFHSLKIVEEKLAKWKARHLK